VREPILGFRLKRPREVLAAVRVKIDCL
jgi:hypothetical protein